jgi:uncharacterized protein YlxW (UPF0749 family)
MTDYHSMSKSALIDQLKYEQKENMKLEERLSIYVNAQEENRDLKTTVEQLHVDLISARQRIAELEDVGQPETKINELKMTVGEWTLVFDRNSCRIVGGNGKS